MQQAKILQECRNPACPFCKGSGVIKIDSPTDGRDLSATCYGDSMGPITESKPAMEQQPQTGSRELNGLTKEVADAVYDMCTKGLDKYSYADYAGNEAAEAMALQINHIRGYIVHEVLPMLLEQQTSPTLQESEAEAIAFAEWIKKEDYMPIDNKDEWVGSDGRYYTIKELYQRFTINK